MSDIGIDISDQSSKLINLKLFHLADIVVTLCKDAYERCPNVLPRSKHIHWGLDDPAYVKGTGEEQQLAFVQTRNELNQLIKDFALNGLSEATKYIDKEESFFPQKDDFGQILQNIRLENKLSVEELADGVGVNHNFIHRAENNQATPSKFLYINLLRS